MPGDNKWQVEKGKGLFASKGVAAVQALTVIQHPSIQLITDLGTGHTTGCATNESTDQRTGQGAQGHTGWTGDPAQLQAGYSTAARPTERTGDATGRACCDAGHGSGFTPHTTGQNTV
jgi:hypothetical protein